MNKRASAHKTQLRFRCTAVRLLTVPARARQASCGQAVLRSRPSSVERRGAGSGSVAPLAPLLPGAQVRERASTPPEAFRSSGCQRAYYPNHEVEVSVAIVRLELGLL